MSTIRLSRAFVVSIKADLVKGRARITFEATLDAEVMAAKGRLAMLSIEEMPVSLLVESAQAELFSDEVRSFSGAGVELP
jgi:hypothetical protein